MLIIIINERHFPLQDDEIIRPKVGDCVKPFISRILKVSDCEIFEANGKSITRRSHFIEVSLRERLHVFSISKYSFSFKGQWTSAGLSARAEIA